MTDDAVKFVDALYAWPADKAGWRAADKPANGLYADILGALRAAGLNPDDFALGTCATVDTRCRMIIALAELAQVPGPLRVEQWPHRVVAVSVGGHTAGEMVKLMCAGLVEAARELLAERAP